MRAQGVAWITCDDPLYPSSLWQLHKPPLLLFCKGNIELLQLPSVGLVGARNASVAATKLAAESAEALGKSGFVIVSGMARGIDTSAHEGSLASGTIAVLGNGLDMVYPAENRILMEQIAQKGLLLSEFRCGTPPRSSHFPIRNRLIAALSGALVVMEAAAQSGSLVTARYALELGKDIFVVPGFPTDPRYSGSLKLLRDGAQLFMNAEDFLVHHLSALSVTTPLLRKRKHEPIVSSPVEKDGVMTVVLNSVSHTPSSIDEIIRKCQTSKENVLAALGTLELMGAIQKTSQNQVVRT